MHQDELRCLLLTRCLPRLPHDIGSALGQARSMSAMQLIAALYRTSRSVRVVPEADIGAGRPGSDSFCDNKSLCRTRPTYDRAANHHFRLEAKICSPF
jgi:hypothetical protein